MPVRHLSCVDGSACGLEKVYNFTPCPALSTLSLSAPNTYLHTVFPGPRIDCDFGVSLMAQLVKNPPALQEAWVQPLD